MQRLVGTLANCEAPDSPKWVFADGVKCSRTFNGKYADLLSAVPSSGDTMEDTGERMIVTTSQLTRKAPDMGVLTVELAGTIVSSESSNDPLKVTVEIDWIAVQKDLRTHPIYATGAEYEITKEGWAKIELWKQETDIALKTATPLFKYKDQTGAEQSLTLNETLAAEKLLVGTDSYNLYAPVVRKTSVYAKQPNPSRCGMIEIPDVTVALPGGNDAYDYLKTAARSVQNQDKTWQLIEEWTGADEIDADLYSLASP